MKEKKNIDRIFQENFKDFEKEPNEKVWDNIASRLDKKDEKRPLIIPLWFKIGGVAAVLAIILASLLFTNTQHPATGEPEIVFENPEKSKENKDSEKESSNKTIDENNPAAQIAAEDEVSENESDQAQSASNNKSSSSSAISSNHSNSATQRSTQKEKVTSKNNPETDIAHEESKQKASTNNEKEKLANTPEATKNKTSGALAQSERTENDSIESNSVLRQENALAELEEKKNSKEETEIAGVDSKKMRLSTFAAPIFYKNIGSGNELSNQLANNGTSSEVTLSYGLKIAYRISPKLKIRTGISKIDINKNIQDISYSPSAMSVGFENISPLEDNVQIRDNAPSPSMTPDSGLPMSTPDNENALTNVVATPGELNQQFGYIEVPLELEYTLIDKKFGLNLIGGGSSLFLDNNRVQLISGDSKTDLGKATNINNTSFSTNVGLGMDYKLTDKFSISVEPIFKYQINTFNNVNNVQPVNFGVYSGLSFRF